MRSKPGFPTPNPALRDRPVFAPLPTGGMLRLAVAIPALALAILPLVSGLSAQAGAGSEASATRAVELEDYYRLKSVGSPALSPDGSRVAYVVTSVLEEENRRHSEVWLANADGSGDPVMVSSPGIDASSPQWSPDGNLLGFVSEGRVFVRADDPAGEPFGIDGLEGSPAFSPDGAWIAFTAPVAPPRARSPRTGRTSNDAPPSASTDVTSTG